jgi:adenosylmethionine-8-amino-7-oxononanoate aminotransferase
MQRIAGEMMSDAVFVSAGVVSHLVASPPLIVTKEEIDRTIDVMVKP